MVARRVQDGTDVDDLAGDEVEHTIRKSLEIQLSHIFETHTTPRRLATQHPNSVLCRPDESLRQIRLSRRIP